MIKTNTKGLDISRLESGAVALECQKRLFSGRDIAYLCQEAISNMVRDENKDMTQLSHLPFEELATKSLRTRPLTKPDFGMAFEKIKVALSPQHLERFSKWGQEFGT